MEFRQGSRQLFEREVYALNEALAVPTVPGGLDGPLEIIDDRQEFLDQLFIAESNEIALVPLIQSLIVIELGSEPEILVIQPFDLVSLCGKSLLKLPDQVRILRGRVITGGGILQALDCIRILRFFSHASLLCGSEDSHRAHKVNRTRKINYLCMGERQDKRDSLSRDRAKRTNREERHPGFAGREVQDPLTSGMVQVFEWKKFQLPGWS